MIIKTIHKEKVNQNIAKYQWCPCVSEVSTGKDARNALTSVACVVTSCGLESKDRKGKKKTFISPWYYLLLKPQRI